MQYKNYKTLFIYIFIFVFCAVALSVNTITACAFDYMDAFPFYGLYSGDGQAVVSGKVRYDLTDNNLFANNQAQVDAEYIIAASDSSVDFSIPFISRYYKMQPPKVFVDGRQVEGEINYGKYHYTVYYDNPISEAIADTFPARLESELCGTLYTVFAEKSDILVNLKLGDGQSLIFDRTTNYTASSEAGRKEFLFPETPLGIELRFFILGDQADNNFTSNCTFEKRFITCEEYVDFYYKAFEQYYLNSGNPEKEYFYSQINAVYGTGNIVCFEDIFIKSFREYRINTFNFSIAPKAETRVTVSASAGIGYNGNYSPYLYGVSFAAAQKYPAEFSVKLNAEYPYIINCPVPFSREGNDICIAPQNENFSLKFCSVEAPLNVYELQEKERTKHKIIMIALAAAFCVFLIGAMVFFIKAADYFENAI